MTRSEVPGCTCNLDTTSALWLVCSMGKRVLNRFRRYRQVIACLAIALLLLPLLGGMLSQPALSAEAQLAHDLGLSVCSPNRQAPTPANDQSDHHGQCILCITHASSLTAPEPALPGIAVASTDADDAVPHLLRTARAPQHVIPPDDSPPRGPPSLA